MVEAIRFKGFALVDILQPCVTFNKKNTYQWYGRMAYKLPPEHDVTNRTRAFELSLEWEERIPLGILYRKERPTFEEMHPTVPGLPLHLRDTSPEAVRERLDRKTLDPAAYGKG